MFFRGLNRFFKAGLCLITIYFLWSILNDDDVTSHPAKRSLDDNSSAVTVSSVFPSSNNTTFQEELASRIAVTQNRTAEGKLREAPDLLRHNFTKLIDCNCSDQTSTDILIFVHTRASSIARRRLIRKTWASVRHHDGMHVRTVFVIGRDVKRPQTQAQIEADAREHGDVIQLDFVDSYRNLTLKHMSGLRWALQQCSRDVKLIVKLDDDVWVNMTSLVAFVRVTSQEQLDNNIWCLSKHRVQVIRKLKSKWTVTKEEYPDRLYPTYCMGAATVYTNRSAQRVVEAALHEDFFWVDDVFFTGTLRLKAGLGIRRSSAFGLSLKLTRDVISRRLRFPGSFLFEKGSVKSWDELAKQELGRRHGDGPV